jgi:hypothetical protein
MGQAQPAAGAACYKKPIKKNFSGRNRSHGRHGIHGAIAIIKGGQSCWIGA